MAELADAADSKSADPCDRGGSTPPPGTNRNAPNAISFLLRDPPRRPRALHQLRNEQQHRKNRGDHPTDDYPS